MKTNIIKAENLKKSYGTLEVLKGVDFTVKRGEIFALLGSNGAGKTTVVKILSTLLRGDGGSAAICGFDVKRQSRQVKGCISLTGQFAAVDEVLTGRENLILIARLRHYLRRDLTQKRESAYGRKSNSFPKMAKPYSLPHSIWRKQNSWPITLPFSTRERLSQMALLQN